MGDGIDAGVLARGGDGSVCENRYFVAAGEPNTDSANSADTTSATVGAVSSSRYIGLHGRTQTT